MLWAFANDLAQRVLTFNKLEQRKNLEKKLNALALPESGKILDFGCGTGLFAKTIMKLGFKYHGYDIDKGGVFFLVKT